MIPKSFSKKFSNHFLTDFLSVVFIVFFQFSFYSQTKTNTDSLSNQLVFELPPNSTIDTLVNLAQFNFESNQDKAIFYANKAYEQAVNENSDAKILLAVQSVADAYYYRDEFVNAIDYYKITADFEKKIYGESSDEYGSRLADIGYCFQLLGVYDITSSYYEKSLAIASD